MVTQSYDFSGIYIAEKFPLKVLKIASVIWVVTTLHGDNADALDGANDCMYDR